MNIEDTQQAIGHILGFCGLPVSHPAHLVVDAGTCIAVEARDYVITYACRCADQVVQVHDIDLAAATVSTEEGRAS